MKRLKEPGLVSFLDLFEGRGERVVGWDDLVYMEYFQIIGLMVIVLMLVGRSRMVSMVLVPSCKYNLHGSIGT